MDGFAAAGEPSESSKTRKSGEEARETVRDGKPLRATRRGQSGGREDVRRPLRAGLSKRTPSGRKGRTIAGKGERGESPALRVSLVEWGGSRGSKNTVGEGSGGRAGTGERKLSDHHEPRQPGSKRNRTKRKEESEETTHRHVSLSTRLSLLGAPPDLTRARAARVGSSNPNRHFPRPAIQASRIPARDPHPQPDDVRPFARRCIASRPTHALFTARGPSEPRCV